MPVSYLPCITPFLLLAIPLLLLFKSRRAAAIGAVVCASLLAVFLLFVYIPGWYWLSQARAGNPQAQYRYAQWLENHTEKIQTVLLWPSDPDVLGGYSWLEKAAAQEYPPAVWLVGVRLKYGIAVPEPPNWNGPGGNVFPQPQRGQSLIDHAVHDLRYEPPGDEEFFYNQHYRRGLPP